jgi:hypothetical protein
MTGAIPPVPHYAFMVWCLVKHRDNFTLTNVKLCDKLKQFNVKTEMKKSTFRGKHSAVVSCSHNFVPEGIFLRRSIPVTDRNELNPTADETCAGWSTG